MSLKKLIEINPKVKVLISSGYSRNGPVKDTMNEGAKSYLIKPYLKDKLSVAVREILDSES